MNIISQRIYQAIKQADLSYGELAKTTGIPKSALQRYATGETETINIDRIKAIADATGVKPEWILNWIDIDDEPEQLTPDEEQLIHYYRYAEERYREFAMELLREHQK